MTPYLTHSPIFIKIQDKKFANVLNNLCSNDRRGLANSAHPSTVQCKIISSLSRSCTYPTQKLGSNPAKNIGIKKD